MERPRLVRLLEAEPHLAGELGGRALAAARLQLLVPYVDLDTEPWTPDPASGPLLAVVVLHGKLLTTALGYAGREDLAVAGPGDVLDARAATAARPLQPIQPARLALLDRRFEIGARVWPQLLPGLVQAMFDSAHEQRRLFAAVKQPHVEDRLIAFMGLLMSRWGTVRPDGVVMSLPVTHNTLGRLVGARRTTVTLALTALARRGLLRRLDGGGWSIPAAALDDAAWASADGGLLAGAG